MRTRICFFAWALLVCLAAQAPRASADVVYSTLEEGTRTGAFHIGGQYQFFQGQRFVPTTTGAVGSLDVPLAGWGGIGTAEFWLAADADMRPGTVIDRFTFPVVPEGATSFSFELLGATSSLRPTLLAGGAYWLLGTAGLVTVNWGMAMDAAGGSWAISGSELWPDGAFVHLGHNPSRFAFRLRTEGAGPPAPVPEPGALLLLASGLVAAVRAKAGRQQAGKFFTR